MGLRVYSISNLLSFFNVQIHVFHKMWKIFSHYFLKSSCLFSLLSRLLYMYYCVWQWPVGLWYSLYFCSFLNSVLQTGSQLTHLLRLLIFYFASSNVLWNFYWFYVLFIVLLYYFLFLKHNFYLIIDIVCLVRYHSHTFP